MADYVELWGEFRKGKTTRNGRPLPAAEMPLPEPVVTLVAPHRIEAFLGARNRREVLAHLRRLRDEGLLISDRDRLQQRVRGQGVRRAFVFRCEAHLVPKVKTAPRESGGGKMRVLLA